MWNLIFIIIGVLGGLITIFTFVFRKNKKFKYAFASDTLIYDDIKGWDNLKVLYNDKLIAGLTVTKIVFWNAGRSSIRGEDIPKGSPLIIRSTENIEILEYEVFESNDRAININLTRKSNREILIHFDVLEYHKGAILKILHTGQSSKDINIHGKIIDQKKIIKTSLPFAPKRVLMIEFGFIHFYFLPIPIILPILLNNSDQSPNVRRRIFGGSFISLGFSFIVVSGVILLFYKLTEGELESSMRNFLWIAFILGVCLIIVGSIIIITKLPMGLDKYENIHSK